MFCKLDENHLPVSRMKINKFDDVLSEKREKVVANKNRKIVQSVKKTENRKKRPEVWRNKQWNLDPRRMSPEQ